MNNYTATPPVIPISLQHTFPPHQLPLAASLAALCLASVLASATSRNLTPLHPSNLVLSLRPYRQTLFVMDQIRLHLEAKVTGRQAIAVHSTLQLQEFPDVFDTCSTWKNRIAVFGAGRLMVRNRLYPTILLGKRVARPMRRFFPTNQE